MSNQSLLLDNLTDTSDQLEGWMPIRVEWQQIEPFIDWCYVGERAFTEPFFDLTIQACLHYPFNLLFRPLTGIDVLRECHATRPGIMPTGFIFHMSRCGSTLITQMLASLEKNIVISEAPPINALLSAKTCRPDITDEERVAWLQWMVSAMGQKRNRESKHFFIKFDAWHTFNLDIIERAFPRVPWIFLYRHPVEVMVSHINQRGAWTIPGIVEHQFPDLNSVKLWQITSEEYLAKLLANSCSYALQHKDSRNGLFLNYTQLPQFVTSTLLKHFNVGYSDEEIERMNTITRFNAKTPVLDFTNDTEQKQRGASKAVRKLSDKLLTPLYEELESVRHERATL